MPNRFVPIGQNTEMGSLIKAVNNNFSQIDSESVTKTFKQANGNAVIQGKLPYGKYGLLLYDENGVARVLVGQAPDDGRVGVWVSGPDQDVIEQLGG